MKRAAFLSAAAFAAVSCSSVSTNVEYDPVAVFSHYKSWTWKDTGEIRDRVWARRVEDVLADTLNPKGLTQVPEGGDLWAAVHARFSVEMQVSSWSSGWGYGWGWGPGPTSVYQIPVGTIIVDLVDAKKQVLVWRGKAHGEIQANRYPEEREKALRKVLADLFAGYPPGAK